MDDYRRRRGDRARGSGLIWVFLLGVFAVVAITAWAVLRIVSATLAPAQGIGQQIGSMFNITPTVLPDRTTVIREIHDLKQLTTASYTVEKVITAEEGQGTFGFLFGDKLLFVAHGKVTAGVDLGKLSDPDVRIGDNRRITMILPQAEVFDSFLDSDKSYVYDRKTGVLRGAGNQNLETSARRVAEQEIRNAALEDGILKLAQTNAESTLRSLLQAVGYTDIVFLTATPSPANSPRPAGVTVGPLVTPTPGQ